jgi:Tol biopolymer transport system component
VSRGGASSPSLYLIGTSPDAAGHYPMVRLTDPMRDGPGAYSAPAVSNLTSGHYRVVFVKVLQGQQRIFWVDVPAPFARSSLNAALPSMLVSAPSSSPSIDAAGARVAFAGPDGSGRSQIRLFQFDRGGGTLTAVTTADSGLSTAPRISADGAAVVFESTANLVGRSNADGNQEVFLYNVARGRMTQLTSTTSTPGHAISNSAPSVNADGSRVAFLSNGNFSRANPDGGVQVYLWTSSRITPITTTPLFDTAQVTVTSFDPCGTLLARNTYATGTVALANGAPWLRGDGSQVAFLSNANLVPDASLATPTTDNRDLSPEIFLASGF